MFFKKKKNKKQDDHLQSTTAISIPEDLKNEIDKLNPEKQKKRLQDKKEK